MPSYGKDQATDVKYTNGSNTAFTSSSPEWVDISSHGAATSDSQFTRPVVRSNAEPRNEAVRPIGLKKRILILCCGTTGCIVVVAAVLTGLGFLIKFLIEYEPKPDEIQFWDEAPLEYSNPNLGIRKSLSIPPRIGQYLHVVGRLNYTANRFCVSLSKDCNDSNNVSCSVCALFGNDSKIIYEAYRSGQRVLYNEAPNPFPVIETTKDLPKIDLRIRFLPDYIQIFAERGEVGIFERLPGVHAATCVKLTGDLVDPSLLELDGDNYSMPFLRPFNYSGRLDMALKPVATVAPAIWDSLIEGQQTPTLRVKRKGGMGGGRGGSAARGASRGSSTGGGFGRSSFTGSGRSSSRTSSISSIRSSIRNGKFVGGSTGSSKYGTYAYSPSYGGYYYGSSAYRTNQARALFFVPASYSYRNVYGGGMVYTRSDAHGNNSDPNFLLDETKIPKPTRIDILYYNGSPNQLPESYTPTFTISFRFSEKAVVLNTFASGSWRLEDRAEFMPIDDWRLFDLTVKPENGKLKIFINNFEFATYEENRELKSSTHFAIQGDVEILSVRSDGRLMI